MASIAVMASLAGAANGARTTDFGDDRGDRER